MRQPPYYGLQKHPVSSIGNYGDTNQLTAGPFKQIWMVIDDDDRFQYWYGLSLNRRNRLHRSPQRFIENAAMTTETVGTLAVAPIPFTLNR